VRVRVRVRVRVLVCECVCEPRMSTNALTPQTQVDTYLSRRQEHIGRWSERTRRTRRIGITSLQSPL